MINNPKASVLLPVYGHDDYLRKAIDSILCQTFRDFELLVISEYETSDECISTIDSYQDERIRHIHNSSHLGLVQSLNNGIGEARGEYVARMDSDDISLPERLARQVAFLDAHAEVGILATGCLAIDSDGAALCTYQSTAEGSFARWLLLFSNYIAHSTVMIRKKVLETVGPYDPSALHCEDYELWMRAARVTRIASIPDVLLHLRRHNRSISEVYPETMMQCASAVSRRAFSEILDRQVPLSYVRALRREKASIATEQEAAFTADLLNHICDVYLEKNNVSRNEREYIEKDTAKRIFELSVLSFPMNPLTSVAIWSKATSSRSRLSLWFVGYTLARMFSHGTKLQSDGGAE